MMKASFTNHLKLKWRRLAPMLLFAISASTFMLADCTVEKGKITARIECDYSLAFTIPGEDILSVELNAFQIKNPSNQTGFTDLKAVNGTWVLEHALGSIAPATEFELKVNCSKGFTIIRGQQLPDWNLTFGTGVGSYTFGDPGSRVSTNNFHLGLPSDPTNIPECGTVGLRVVEVIPPWCSFTNDGRVRLQITGTVDDKCSAASFRVTVDTLGQMGVGAMQTGQIGDVLTFNNLTAGQFVASIESVNLTCPGMIVANPNSVGFTVVRRSGSTTSMSCIDKINVSVSESCKATIGVYDMLLGINDPCALETLVPDSIAVSIDKIQFIAGAGSGSSARVGMSDLAVARMVAAGTAPSKLLPVVEIPNADIYIGQELTIEVFDFESGNSCWGTALLEDKSPPVVICDDTTRTRILCLEFAGDITNTLIDQAEDCSELEDPVIISQNLIEDCDNIDDNVLRRLTASYTISDVLGNRSDVCTDTIDVLRFDTIPNGRFDLPGQLLFPCDFVQDPDEKRNEKDPLSCTQDYVRIGNTVAPAPIDTSMGGSGFPQLKWMNSRGMMDTALLLPMNYREGNNAYQLVVKKLLDDCGVGLEFEDRIFEFGCKIKILRTWTIFEWACENGQTIEQELELGVQEIVITDFVAPVITGPVPDKEFSVNAFDCSRRLPIELPEANDDCDQNGLDFDFSIFDEDWQLIGPTVDPITREPDDMFNFPLGLNYVVYRVTDDCDNFVLDTAAVNIIDETPPVVICKEFLAVGLSSEGSVRVPAEAFDNGSFDDCGLERTCVIRMDDLDMLRSIDADRDGEVLFDDFAKLTIACGRDYSEYAYQKTPNGPFFIDEDRLCTPYVVFCCEDNVPPPGETMAPDIMINFRAYDINGNQNGCMVFVDLQDKQRPEITCLPDITIDCNFDLPEYDAFYDNIENDPLSDLFGSIVEQNEQKAFGIPSEFIISPADRSGLVDGVFFDNCRDPRIEVRISDEFDNCGFGTITRRIQAFDGLNSSDICVQVIRVRRTIFDDASIIWPRDTTLNECAIPEDLVDESFGTPIVVGDDCSLIGISEENQIFTFNTADESADACFKILRHWTVIDWCQSSNGGQPFVLGDSLQIIKVNDPDGPGLTCGPDLVEESVNCVAENVMLMATAFDDCTDALDMQWSARIEAFVDENLTFIPVDVDDITISEVAGDSSKAVLLFDAPIGRHRIVWTVTDRCGNSESCTQRFEVRNSKKPTPIAINVSTALMNTTDSVEIWAEDFDLDRKSFHGCFDLDDPIQDRIFYRLSYTDQTFAESSANLTFTCADSVLTFLKFYAAIELGGEVVWDHTIVQLRVIDSDNSCPARGAVNGNSGASALITGNIRTETAVNVPNVIVDLLTEGNQGASALEAVKTDQSGMYAFPAMPSGGDYMISPISGDDYLNGVSTLDLVMIQRYVLGMMDLDSPYKLLAADINNDREVSAIDLVELRKVLLGYETTFPNNDSWKFVDSDYTFSDESRPWEDNVSTSYSIAELDGDMSVDFIGIKVGDINGSVDAASVVAKSRSQYRVTAGDVSYTPGQTIAVPVRAQSDIQTVGTQFMIGFETGSMRFVGIESGAMDIQAEHIGALRAGEGQVAVSWSNPRGIDLAEGEEMFTLLFEAQQSGRVSDHLTLTTDDTAAEIYTSSLDVMDLRMTYEQEIGSSFQLLQNTPNPFAETTSIGFSLPTASTATLTVHDVTGKLLHSYTGSFDKGSNIITVNTSELSTSGVMYYTLATEEFTDTKRMVVLK
ncbi:MAG: T9SS type A sorting domain-containing protein [Bacteroidota bacterium]